MLGEEGKEEKAEVSKSNKSSNAEQFLPVQSGSVELIFNPETGLCLVALAVGRRVQSSDQAPPGPFSLPRRCFQVQLSWPARGRFPAAPRSVTGA